MTTSIDSDDNGICGFQVLLHESRAKNADARRLEGGTNVEAINSVAG